MTFVSVPTFCAVTCVLSMSISSRSFLSGIARTCFWYVSNSLRSCLMTCNIEPIKMIQSPEICTKHTFCSDYDYDYDVRYKYIFLRKGKGEIQSNITDSLTHCTQCQQPQNISTRQNSIQSDYCLCKRFATKGPNYQGKYCCKVASYIQGSL